MVHHITRTVPTVLATVTSNMPQQGLLPRTTLRHPPSWRKRYRCQARASSCSRPRSTADWSLGRILNMWKNMSSATIHNFYHDPIPIVPLHLLHVCLAGSPLMPSSSSYRLDPTRHSGTCPAMVFSAKSLSTLNSCTSWSHCFFSPVSKFYWYLDHFALNKSFNHTGCACKLADSFSVVTAGVSATCWGNLMNICPW